MKILISPFSKKLRNGNENPKDYPYWDKLLELIKKHEIKQIGIAGEKILVKDYYQDRPFTEIKQLLDWCDIWISVDNWFPHFVNNYGDKKGIVLWGKSDPKLFGYDNNINLLKGEKNLRKNQFDIWENEVYDENVFVLPEEILKYL